jgi:hypothetical protein
MKATIKTEERLIAELEYKQTEIFANIDILDELEKEEERLKYRYQDELSENLY